MGKMEKYSNYIFILFTLRFSTLPPFSFLKQFFAKNVKMFLLRA